ncbi:hypothetical protein HZ326_21845 [Fusarium oxysporum f. sp. albedinis]|nr:hypothetical protein HZ326_21845 [Fusarium oxysporum f. sp. albedinis]
MSSQVPYASIYPPRPLVGLRAYSQSMTQHTMSQMAVASVPSPQSSTDPGSLWDESTSCGEHQPSPAQTEIV